MAKQIEKLELVTGVVIVVAIVVAAFALLRLDSTGRSGSNLPAEYDYDIEELKRVDSDLILYAESEPEIKTGFAKAVGIAVGEDGNVCVVGDMALKVFSPEGSFLHEIELLLKPAAVTVLGDDIYVLMQGRVSVFDTSFQLKASFDLPTDGSVYSSIAAADKDVFVADAGNRVVLRYSVSGELLGRIGEKDVDRRIPGFSIPSPYFDLAIADDGLLRVVNPGMHRVEAYTFDGDLEFWWGVASSAIEGFCGCCNPCNFAIMENGNFITAEKGIVRVKEYDSEGEFIGVVASFDQLLNPTDVTAAFDVAVDSTGRVYVLDTINQAVRVFVRKQVGDE